MALLELERAVQERQQRNDRSMIRDWHQSTLTSCHILEAHSSPSKLRGMLSVLIHLTVFARSICETVAMSTDRQTLNELRSQYMCLACSVLAHNTK